MSQTSIKKKKAFTLVELIIVITILAILATIAFVSFQWYLKSSRDSNRVSSIAGIKKWLEMFSIQVWNYPTPDGTIVSGNINGLNLVKVGEVQDTLSKIIKMRSLPKDPLTLSNYVYGISSDNKYYQIATIKEDLNSYVPLVGLIYAAWEQARVEWNYNGFIKFNSWSEIRVANIPSLIYSNTGSVELLSGSTYYVVNKKLNLPYNLKWQKDTSIYLTDANSIIKDITKSASSTLTGVNITNATSSTLASIFTGNLLLSFNVLWWDISNTGAILSSIQTSFTQTSNKSNITEKIGSSITAPASSCNQILSTGTSTSSGMYWITDAWISKQMYCDMSVWWGTTLDTTDTFTNLLARNPSLPQCKSATLQSNCYTNRFGYTDMIYKMDAWENLFQYNGNGTWIPKTYSYQNIWLNCATYLYCGSWNNYCLFGRNGPANCCDANMKSACITN